MLHLLKLSVKKKKSHKNVWSWQEGIWLSVPFGPSLDSKAEKPFIPVHPEVAAEEGIQVPLIIGHNSREGIIHLKGMNMKKTERWKKLQQLFSYASRLSITRWRCKR